MRPRKKGLCPGCRAQVDWDLRYLKGGLYWVALCSSPGCPMPEPKVVRRTRRKTPRPVKGWHPPVRQVG